MDRGREGLSNEIVLAQMRTNICNHGQRRECTEDRREPSPKANREAALKRVREQDVGLMRRGDGPCCVFVFFRVAFVSHRVAVIRRMKRGEFLLVSSRPYFEISKQQTEQSQGSSTSV